MRILLSAAVVAASLFGGVTIAPQSADAAVTRTTAHLNLRFGPGANYRRVTTIPPGQIVNVHGCPTKWCAVSWRRHKGYVNSRYLSTHKTMVVSPTYMFGR